MVDGMDLLNAVQIATDRCGRQSQECKLSIGERHRPIHMGSFFHLLDELCSELHRSILHGVSDGLLGAVQ